MKKLTHWAVSALTAFSVTAATNVMAEDSPVPDTVNFTVPFGVGGGTDVWARFMAPNLTSHIDGEPTIVIKNQPGGGSLTGTNLFYKRAKDDGSSIIGTSASTLFPYMLGDKRVRFKLDDWTPILASPTGGVVYVQPNLGVASSKDVGKLLDQELKLASQGPTRLELPILIALDLLGADVKPVFGMKSRGAGRLAFERGEATIDFQTSSAYIRNVKGLVEANKAVPVFSVGVMNKEGNIVRDPAFPGIPTFEEAYFTVHGKQPSGMQYDVYRKFLAAGFAFQKVIFVPSDAPSDVLAAYNKGVREMIKDPKFKAEAAVQIGPYQNAVGLDIATYLSDAVTISPEMYTWISDWLKAEFNYKL
ncbi:tricarboxylate transporter [Marinomonas balearica]|uniref:Tripartite-type tricarboxylate transporter receptor subunit TctC n=1 Tax=Marinomonas balearica TaxID=491947 RepID=A0A4R6MCX5_9GAMM|nr:tricarboxylate transporter [Marinomonas balearica]TDO98119.1 tripartite-type tricarboxylate transporter receptor subunit TctC [Marinomonas balearica]